jgi:porphobilinogen deaminase
MKDQRIKVFRGAVDDLLESLEAHLRVSRWSDPGGVPEPLSVAATKLLTRLGVAHRLASGVFVGTPTDSNKVGAMCVAMKRLDVAYVTYRTQVERAPHDSTTASVTLEAEIAEVRNGSHLWR